MRFARLSHGRSAYRGRIAFSRCHRHIAAMLRSLGKFLGLSLIVLIAATAGIWWFGRTIEKMVNPAPETIVSASLQGLREQNRLSAFLANYVAIVTSRQSRFGLSAQKTLILPGTVRYEVDLGRLREQDVRWDGRTQELFVTLPAIELSGPQIDLTQIREYDSGGLLMRLTDVSKRFDDANRRAAQAELIRQAREPVPMNLAKDATRRAIERSFALPLRATGLNASVRVRFADEKDFPDKQNERMDHSRSLDEVYSS
jgi:hypothetical protein